MVSHQQYTCFFERSHAFCEVLGVSVVVVLQGVQ